MNFRAQPIPKKFGIKPGQRFRVKKHKNGGYLIPVI